MVRGTGPLALPTSLRALSLLWFPQCCYDMTTSLRNKKGMPSSLPLRASGRAFPEGRHQKSARKSRMAVILLFFSSEHTYPSLRHHLPTEFTKCLIISFSHSMLAFCLLFPFNRRRKKIQRHFPRISEEEAGLSSDPQIPVPLLNKCTLSSPSPCPVPKTQEPRRVLLPRDLFFQ